MRAERSDAGSAQGRGYPSPRAGSSAPRSRPADRGRPPAGRRVPPPAVRNDRDDEWGYDRGRDRDRGHDRDHDRGHGRDFDRGHDRVPGGSTRRPAPPARSQRDERLAARSEGARESTGTGLRGAVVVLGMFLLTLVAAAADSYLGVGLGTITLIALLLSTVGACLLVRRRDLLTVVVAPPLVFVGVAMANIALAPSATFSLPTLATLLIRGFPAMGLAVAVAVLIFLGRLASRR